MSYLLTREVLHATVIDRDVSQDLYTYDAAVREPFADDAAPRTLGTLDFHPWLSEFTD